MKVLVLTKNEHISTLFTDFPTITSREEALMAFVGRHWDVVIAGMEMVWIVEELKKKGRVFWTIFIAYSCTAPFYKRALEVGDFCYLISTPQLVRIRLEWLRQQIFKRQGELYPYQGVVYNFKLGKLYSPNGEEIGLTRGEKDVLEVLIKNRERFVSNREILENSDISSEESIKVLVSRLRKKGFKIINRSRIGYRLIEPDERETGIKKRGKGNRTAEKGKGIQKGIQKGREKGKSEGGNKRERERERERDSPPFYSQSPSNPSVQNLNIFSERDNFSD